MIYTNNGWELVAVKRNLLLKKKLFWGKKKNCSQIFTGISDYFSVLGVFQYIDTLGGK